MRKMKRSCIKVQNMNIWRFDSLDRRLKMSSANVRLILHQVAQPTPQSPNAILAKSYYALRWHEKHIKHKKFAPV